MRTFTIHAYIWGLAFSLVLAMPVRADDAPQPQKNLPYGALNRALTENIVLPAYRALVPAMEKLAAASKEFCIDPPTGSHARVVDSFNSAMAAWQTAQSIGFGPVTKDNRTARFEFWPDTGASTDRQIRRVLTERDPALVADGGLTGKSVALQNLSTFERLLAENVARLAGAGNAATEEDKYACAWISEIARFQVRLAHAVFDEWSGTYASIVAGAEQGNAAYADARAAATDYLKSLSAIIDIVIRQKLERPMDASVAKARASRAESWRTKRSMANIVANLETARAFVATPNGFADLLKAAGAEALGAGMIGQFDTAIAHANAIGQLEDALGDTAMRPKLDELLRMLRSLRVLIQGPLATETELTVGFNAMDGD
jgi:predicted lipoprotein